MALELDYCGFTIPNAFVIGYGADYNDDYRHLPYVEVYSPPLDTPRLKAMKLALITPALSA